MGVTHSLLSAISTPLFLLGHLAILLSRPYSVAFADLLYIIGVILLSAIFIAKNWEMDMAPPNFSLALVGFLLSCVYCHWLSVKPSFSLAACWIAAVLIFLHGLFLIAPQVVGEISGVLDFSFLATEYLGSAFSKETLTPYLERIPYHSLPIAAGIFLFANTNGYLSLKSKSTFSIFGHGLKMTGSLMGVFAHALQRIPSLTAGYAQLQLDVAVTAICIVPLVMTLLATEWLSSQNKTVRQKPKVEASGGQKKAEKANGGETSQNKKKKKRKRK